MKDETDLWRVRALMAADTYRHLEFMTCSLPGAPIQSSYSQVSWMKIPGGATLNQLTPDVWAQIGGKWGFFWHRGRERCPPTWVYFKRVYTCMSVLLESLQSYRCISRKLTPIMSL